MARKFGKYKVPPPQILVGDKICLVDEIDGPEVINTKFLGHLTGGTPIYGFKLKARPGWDAKWIFLPDYGKKSDGNVTIYGFREIPDPDPTGDREVALQKAADLLGLGVDALIKALDQK